MSDFFRGWRKKMGCVTLVMALVLLCGWVRSHTNRDRFGFSTSVHEYDWIGSFHGKMMLQRVAPGDIAKWKPDLFRECADGVTENLWAAIMTDDDKIQWKWNCLGFDFGRYVHESSISRLDVMILKISYWMFITPLTLLSTLLLLWEPRKSSAWRKRDKFNFANIATSSIYCCGTALNGLIPL